MGLLRVRELSSFRSEGLPSGTCHLGCNLPELVGKIIIPQSRVKFRLLKAEKVAYLGDVWHFWRGMYHEARVLM